MERWYADSPSCDRVWYVEVIYWWNNLVSSKRVACGKSLDGVTMPLSVSSWALDDAPGLSSSSFGGGYLQSNFRFLHRVHFGMLSSH